MIKVEATKPWWAKIRGQITREQASALSKALMVIGVGLATKPFLDMHPNIGSAIIRGAIFAVAIILCLRTVRVTPRLRQYMPWFIPLTGGAFLNWLVVMVNGGFMPATLEQTMHGIYIPMAGSNLPYLGDWVFGFISPGDVVLFVAFAGLILTMVANRKRGRSSPSAESAKAGVVSTTPATKDAT